MFSKLNYCLGSKFLQNIKLFIKKEPELIGSFLLAVLSCMFIKPSIKYLNYIDFDVLIVLFCLMLVISGFAKNNLFAYVSRYFIYKAKHTRELCLILILASFFSAMLVTNDVALIIFVPLSSVILSKAGLHEYILFVTVMQTVAANLGSMFTPIGNPQNIFLYSYFKLTFQEFFSITFPITLASFFIIIPPIFWIKQKKLQHVIITKEKNVNKFNIALFSFLFIICLAAVFRFLEYNYLLLVVCLITFFFDKSLFKLVDYKLILTFLFFFIFCGNFTSIQIVKSFFVPYIKGNEFLVAILSSQFISNVPTALILAGFTDNYEDLILGTNIGGLGTIIASMSSLIAFRYYKTTTKANPLLYLFVFSIVNIFILAILIIFVLIDKVYL